MLEDFRAALEPGAGVIDIGANVGEYARVYAAKVGPTGYVLAVEADPSTVKVCRHACAEFPTIHVRHAAVLDREGAATIHRDGKDHRRNSLWAANVIEPNGESLEVPTVTLDSLAVEVPNLRAIKIDAQGAEAAIVRGAPETLQRRDVTWQVELWHQGLLAAGASIEELAETFARNGWYPAGWTWPRVCEAVKSVGQHGSVDVVLRWQAA